MYKHLASSILENDNRMFISQSDKDKYDNYENIFIEKDNTYTKEEINMYTRELYDSYTTFESDGDIIKNIKSSVSDNIEIYGNTEYKYDIYTQIIYRSKLLPGSINDQGENDDSENAMSVYCRTDLQEIVGGDIIKYFIYSLKLDIGMYFYNSDKVFISSCLVQTTEEVSAPIGAKYVKFTHEMPSNQIDNTRFTIKRTNMNELVCVKDNLSVNVVGKNLFECSTVNNPNDGISEVVTDSNSITVASNRLTGSNYTMSEPIKLIPGKRYRVSCENMEILEGGSEAQTAIRVAYTHKSPYSNSKTFVSLGYLYSNSDIYQFTVTEESKYISLGFYTQRTATSTVENKRVKYSNVSIEEVNSDIGYEEYKSCKNVIKLPYGVELNSVNNVKDRIFKRDDGVWCLEKNVLSITLNGSERWTMHSSTLDNTQSFYTTLSTEFGISFPTVWQNKLIATRYELISGITVTDKEGINLAASTSNNLWLRVKLSDASTTPELRDYLSRNNIEVKIENPYPEIIELHDFDPLVEFLEGYNHITVETVNNSKPILKVEAPVSLRGTVNDINDTINSISKNVQNIKNMKQAIAVNHTSKYHIYSIDNVGNGVIDDIKIKGSSVVNVAEGFANSDQTYSYIGTVDTNGVVTESLDDYRVHKSKLLEDNKTYTIIVNVHENTITNQQTFVLVDAIDDDDYFIAKEKVRIPSGFTGNFKATFKTKSNTQKHFKSYLRTRKGATEYGHIKLGPYTIVEGDYTDRPLTHFTGIKSINSYNKGILTLSTRNEEKNIIDVKEFQNTTNTTVKGNTIRFENTTGVQSYSRQFFVPVEIGCEYTINVEQFDKLDPNHYGYLIVQDGFEAPKNSSTRIDHHIRMRDYDTIAYKITPMSDKLRMYITTDKENTIGSFSFRVSMTKSSNNTFEHESDKKEIVMVKDLVNIYDGYNEPGDMNWSDGTDEDNSLRTRSGFIDIEGKSIIDFNVNPTRVIFYDENKTFISAQNVKTRYSVPSNTKYVRFSVVNENVSIQDVKLQAYSPIILRSTNVNYKVYDTIEKHDDGKYYYHKRCGEVEVNGSNVTWSGPSNAVDETHRFLAPIYGYNGLPTLQNGCTTNYPCTGGTTHNNSNLNLQIAESSNTGIYNVYVRVKTSNVPDVETFKKRVNDNPIKIVYVLNHEEIYEVAPLDLKSYDGSTSVLFSDYIIPTEIEFSTNNGIGNIVNKLRETVSSLENIINEQNITNNKFMLTSMYAADRTTLKVDLMSINTRRISISEDLFKLIYKNIMVGKYNYDREKIEEIIDFYIMIGSLNFNMGDVLFELIEKHHSENTIL